MDFVSAKEIFGLWIVEECPCHGLSKYEELIWHDREVIDRYLKVRVEQEYRWAEEQLTLNKLKGI